MINMNRLLAWSGLMAFCLAVSPIEAYAAVAGHVQFVSGNVQVTSATGQVRQAEKGGPINEGDLVSSAQQSSIQIKMQDGGFIAVRPNTRLKIEQFKFSGQAEGGNDRSFFSLIKGGFRSITGLIGQVNKQNYRVTTPAATIGIRGTDYEAVYMEAAPVNLAAAEMLLAVTDAPAPMIGGGFAAAIVNKGAIEMGTNKGTTLLQPGQGMVVSYGMNQLPVIKPLDINLFPGAGKSQPSDQEGRKGGKGEKQQDDAKGESDKTADNGEETTGDSTTADGGTAGDATTEPVRETAVVDAAPPATGGVPAAVTPTADAGVTTTLPAVPVVQPLTLAVNGQTVNLATQTIAPTGGGTAVPITGTNPLYPAPNGFGYEVLGVDAVGTWFNPFAINLPASSYLLDTTNNLMEVLGQVKFAGGVAKDTYKSLDGSVYMGRWQAGTVTDQFAGVLNMGTNSSQWVFAANPAAGYVQTLGGVTNYSLTAATHPTDALGNVGTLTSATLTANFTTQVVNISLALSFSTADPVNISTQNKAFTVTTPNGIPISGQEIWGVGAVACTGANCDSAAGYTANIWGRFAASKADKVAIPYDLTGNMTDRVQGVALVTSATPPLVAPPVVSAPYVQTDVGVAFVSGSSNYLSRFVQLDTLIAKTADINNALPNPSFTDRYAGKDAASFITYTLNGTTTVGQAATTLANGIQFGRYDSTSAQMVVVGNTDCCAAGTTSSNTAVYSHWIAGPAVNPVYLPEVLTTNATYTLAGGTTPTVSPNFPTTPGTATLNGASLSVNFTQQLVAFNLSLTVNGAAWTASTTGTPLEMMYWNSAKVGFRATTFARPGWGPLTVTGTGANNGDVVGQLTGNGLNGAILSYVLNGANDQVTGVAAFTGAAQNAATPYRIAALSTIDTIPAGLLDAGLVVPVTMGGYNNANNVTFDGAGNAVQFVTDKPFSNGGSSIAISSGTAAVAGLGTDPVSGISWGRWVGGSLAVTDRVTNTTAARANNSSSHWITGPVMTGPVTLPVSGTYNYVLAGGTAPTDSLGNVGTLNSATLSANFTAQTVNVGLNVTTAGAGNLVASGVNIPIEQKNFFGASTPNAPNGGPNGGLLTVTCQANCGAGVLSGHLGGVFTGSGATGAGMVYGLQNGTVIVNGVAAFHR